MRILVLTSCTGQKAVDHELRLTLADFAQGPAHVAQREAQLRDLLTPAQTLYTGQQHVRLMRGIDALARLDAGIAVDIHIVSAGYGLVDGSQRLAPYEATFIGMHRAEIRELAARLQLPRRVAELLSSPYDLILVLLGDDYLSACEVTSHTPFGGPTILFCGTVAAKRFTPVPNLRVVTLSNADAKRFSCGLVGLKGELAGSLLQDLAEDSSLLATLLDPNTDILELLTPRPPTADPRVDWVVDPPPAWQSRSKAHPIKYFIPDWHDLVDPDYDFEHDRPSRTPAHWTNQVYAHQLYGEPQYDGILVSRAVLDSANSETRRRLYERGIHRYLRVSEDVPVMGDCGAFAYVNEDEPPYTTADVIDYYTNLGFNYGVSIDHLIPPYKPKDMSQYEFDALRRARYNLTIKHAEAFLHAHGQRYPWTAIGAVQGWDAPTYAAAAKHYVDVGYTHIALGAMVPRSRHPHLILPILRAVHGAVGGHAQIHLFGVATATLLPAMRRYGITSMDSAAMLRKAWEGHSRNYLTPAGWYPAIRIPPVKRDAPASLRRLEGDCLRALRDFARGDVSAVTADELMGTAELLARYDHEMRPDRRSAESVADIVRRYTRVLADRPWAHCGCAICTEIGVEVIIFRGNNRNRRRGFHNTYVFNALLDNGAFDLEDVPRPEQLALPELALT